MPSKKANRYGTLAERKAAEQYRLRRAGEHTSWCDAVRQDGTPVEIKSCDLTRESPRFRLFETYHDRLHAADGYYVFVAYRPRGRGITVVNMRLLHASSVPIGTWYGAGGHRNSRQCKLAVGDVI